MNTFGGMKIVVSDRALAETEERNFPASQHRSARIHKKLVKRYGGEFRKAPCIWEAGGIIVCHPARYAELKSAIAAQP